MITIYGIKNCDTVKKARKWLEAEGLDHRFHDFRGDGIDAALVARFVDALGFEAVLNTRGTTWRKLSAAEKADVDSEKACGLMLANEALIKRPVWEKDGDYRLGFAAKDMDGLTTWLKA